MLPSLGNLKLGEPPLAEREQADTAAQEYTSVDNPENFKFIPHTLTGQSYIDREGEKHINWPLTDTDADGNCFYHAILHLNNYSLDRPDRPEATKNMTTVSHVRGAIADYLWKNKNDGNTTSI